MDFPDSHSRSRPAPPLPLPAPPPPPPLPPPSLLPPPPSPPPPWHVSPQRWVSFPFDVATQAMRGHYVEFTGGQGEYRTMPFR